MCTDTVATAAMGYDPRAQRDTAPFRKCDNTLLLAEANGVGARISSGSKWWVSDRESDVPVRT